MARCAVSVLRDRRGSIPIDASQPITLINTTKRSAYDVLTNTRGIGPNQAKSAFDVFAATLRSECADVTLIAAEDCRPDDLPQSGVIIAVTENYTLPGMDFDQSLQVKLIRQLQEHAGDRLIVVALRDPYELADFPEIDSYLCSFSFRPPAAKAAAECLLGQIKSGGRTPVTVPNTELIAQSL